MDVRLSYLEALPENVEEKVLKGHIKDEADKGIVCNFKQFSLVAATMSDEIIAVLTASTAFCEIYVDDIWVAPAHRRHGIGKKLIEDLEHRFADQGYNNINLVTSEFTDAQAFYEKCGFELEFARINKKNPKLTKYFFIKYFSNQNQYQGIKEST